MKHPIIKTIEQAKKLIKIVIGFTILVFGFIMLFTPGPGLLTITFGLGILGTEFLWAKRLLKRFEKEAVNIKNSFLNNYINKNHKNGDEQTVKEDKET